jgi:DNA-binding response OmpR family regulator
MFQKHKIIITNFGIDSSSALVDWINEAGGFEALQVDLTIDNAASIIDEATPHLILIDSDNCDLQILAILGQYQIPIISIGKQSIRENGKIAVHLTKPIRLGELETKIRFSLRAQEVAKMSLIKIEEFELNPARKSLMDKNGNELKLTDKEVAILTYLNSASGNAVSREELLREVWRYNTGVTTHTLETHIYKLRQKLSTIIGQKEVLLTQEGGYQLDTAGRS